MQTGDRRNRGVLAIVALFIVAPIAAAVIVSVLLLFGVTPQVVFLPGFFLKSRLSAAGLHVPNAVGVLATVFLWWVIVVVLWLTVRRLWR